MIKLGNIVLSIVDLTAKALGRLRITFGIDGIVIEVAKDEQPIDHRIKKLEEAREALSIGLTAVEDLQMQANQSKINAEQALRDLQKLESEKSQVQEEVTAVRNAISTDIETFRKVAGIPDEAQRRRDKLTGFVSGVLASIVASIIVAGAVYAFRQYQEYKTVASDNTSVSPKPAPAINQEYGSEAPDSSGSAASAQQNGKAEVE